MNLDMNLDMNLGVNFSVNLPRHEFRRKIKIYTVIIMSMNFREFKHTNLIVFTEI